MKKTVQLAKLKTVMDDIEKKQALKDEKLKKN